MHLIKNTLSGPYHEFIRTLRNNERVKDGFIQQEKITKKAHLKYMLMH